MMSRTVTIGLLGGFVLSAGFGCRDAQHDPLKGGPQGWKSLSPLGAGPRQETAVVAVEGLIYVLGGFTADLTIVPRVEAYHPKSDTWMEVAPLPRPLHHANAAAVGDRLYVLGALIQNSFTAIGDTYVYDPSANAWSQLTSMPAGSERGAGGTAAIGSKVYVAGGLRQNISVTDFSAYDTATDTWEILPSFSEPRDHLVAGSTGEKFYAVGGRRNGALRGNVDEFDPTTGDWIPKAPMLTARAGTAGAVVANRIIVAGGEGSPKPSGVFPDNEIYDPTSDTWKALEPMLTPRHGTGGASIENVFFVPGGATRQGFGAVDTNESYTLVPTY